MVVLRQMWGFGSYLNLDKQELAILGKAAMLHDIGKKLIPYTIIGKKEKLTHEEFEMVKEHPQLSVKVLRECGETDERLIKLVLQHHEKCDGSGYPFGLVEDEIEYLAQIIAVCDVSPPISAIIPLTIFLLRVAVSLGPRS